MMEWTELFPATEGLRQFVSRVNAAGGTYHRLPLGPDLIVQGDYNMTSYLPFYHLPDDLVGKTVLDVGPGSGFFSFECLRRGAEVTAIDVWENPLLVSVATFAARPVRYVRASVYDLNENFGQFDIVFCGSLILHLPDPVGALQKIRMVSRERAIVATTCPEDSENNPRPICDFTGQQSRDGKYWSYWAISAEALRRMILAAGFSEVQNIKHYVIEKEAGRVNSHRSAHVAATGLV
jgi:tRNA (mo5U34)-methyltransferase